MVTHLLLLLLVTGCLAQYYVDKIFGSGGWEDSDLSMRPWVAGVHRKESDGTFKQICGGSLVSLRVIISAAHCFYKEGTVLPPDRFVISAENYYRELGYNEQKGVVKQIVVHERYRSSKLRYAHDIAAVKLFDPFTSTKNVNPIAIDWSWNFYDDQLRGQVGTVVGWGVTEHNEPSNFRTAVNLPYVDFDTCWNTVPIQFQSSITADKFCAGLQNGTNVCPGDSGGGLAFYSNSTATWYLRGIVSVGPQPTGDNKCHTAQLSAYISIAFYRVWLANIPHFMTNSTLERSPINERIVWM